MFHKVLFRLQEQIMLSVHKQYICVLKDNLVEYTWVTHLAMTDLGTLVVKKFAWEINVPWSNDDHVGEYIWKQVTRKEKLAAMGSDVCDPKMMVKFIKQMYHLGHFVEQDMKNGEKKAMGEKT